MEPIKKKKRVTFKKKHQNLQIKLLLKDLYSRLVGRDHNTALKIECAVTSLSKYPLSLSSGLDCYILQGFDRNLCTYVDEKLHETEPIISDEIIHIPEKYLVHNSSEDKEIQTHKITEDKSSGYVKCPVLNSTDYDKIAKSYKLTPNSVEDATILALYIQQVDNPSRSALEWNHMCEKAKQHTTKEGDQLKWNCIKTLRDSGIIGHMIIGGVAKFFLSDLGMAVGKRIWQNRHDILVEMTSQNIDNHTHSDECSTLGCNVHRVVPPQTGRSLVQDKILFIDMPPGTYEVIMVVDKNETQLLTTLAKFPKVESRSLKVGDILWVARSKINGHELVLPFIVERKRIDDFAASIKDGRFHEQKFRLRKCGLRHVIYLIEDDPKRKTKYCGLPEDTLEQAKINTRIQDGFLIHETDSLKGTKRYLELMTSGIIKNLKGQNLRGTNSENPGKELMLYDQFNASSLKTKPLTVKEAFIKMLLQLKGLSVEKSLAITNKFNSPKALMNAYNGLEKKEQELLLAKLRYNSYLPKVGPTISKALSMLFNYMSFDISANGKG